MLATLVAAGCGGVDPEASFAAAEASFAEHDYREASIHARNTLQAQEDHIGARIVLGRASLALEELDDAEFHLRRAADAGAEPSAYAVPLAETRLRAGDADAALELLDRVPVAERGADDWAARSAAYLRKGDFDAAKESLDQVPEPAGPAVLAARARLAMALRDVPAAAALARQAAEAAPDEPEILALLARIEIAAGAPAEAEAPFDRAAEAYRERGQFSQASFALLQLVQVQLAQGKTDDADATARRLAARFPDSVPAHYAAGLVALRNGDAEGAVASLRSAAAKAPGNPELDSLLGAAYLAAGNLGQAEQQLLAALDPSRPSPAVVRMLAETRLRQQRPGPALEALRRLDVEVIEQDPALALLQGAASLETGDTANAVRFLEIAVDAAPAHPGATLQLARAYSEAGRTDDAARLVAASPTISENQAFASNLALTVQTYQTRGEEAAEEFVLGLLEDNPRDPTALLTAATFDYLTGDKTSARRRADEALTIQNDFVPALLMVASLESEAGRAAEAESLLRQVLEIEPGHSAASLAMARMRVADDDSEGAREVLRAAAARDGAPAPLIAALGDLERRLGAGDEAQRLAEDLKSRFPERPEGHLLEARLHSEAGRPAEAGRAFRAAYDAQPSWEALRGAVSAMRTAGDPGWEALLEQRLEAEPNDVASRLLLADGLQTSSRNAEALSEYEEILARDTDNVVALNNAAWLASGTDAPKALGYANRAAELAPESPAVLDTLGWILAGEGRLDEALPHLEKAAQLSPDALEIRYHLAVAQARAGDNQAARRTLEDLLAEERPFPSRDDARALLESL